MNVRRDGSRPNGRRGGGFGDAEYDETFDRNPRANTAAAPPALPGRLRDVDRPLAGEPRARPRLSDDTVPRWDGAREQRRREVSEEDDEAIAPLPRQLPPRRDPERRAAPPGDFDDARPREPRFASPDSNRTSPRALPPPAPRSRPFREESAVDADDVGPPPRRASRPAPAVRRRELVAERDDFADEGPGEEGFLGRFNDALDRAIDWLKGLARLPGRLWRNQERRDRSRRLGPPRHPRSRERSGTAIARAAADIVRRIPR